MTDRILYEKMIDWRWLVFSYSTWIMLFVIVFEFLLSGSGSLALLLFWTGIFFYDIWHTLKSLSYRIMSNGLVFYGMLYGRPKWFIPIDQIKAVRYEDGFTTFYGAPYILIYPVNPYYFPSNSRDRLSLKVRRSWSSRKDIAAILRAFSEAGVDVTVRTSSKQLIKKAGLEQWNEVGKAAV